MDFDVISEDPETLQEYVNCIGGGGGLFDKGWMVFTLGFHLKPQAMKNFECQSA